MIDPRVASTLASPVPCMAPQFTGAAHSKTREQVQHGPPLPVAAGASRLMVARRRQLGAVVAECGRDCRPSMEHPSGSRGSRLRWRGSCQPSPRPSSVADTDVTGAACLSGSYCSPDRLPQDQPLGRCGGHRGRRPPSRRPTSGLPTAHSRISGCAAITSAAAPGAEDPPGLNGMGTMTARWPVGAIFARGRGIGAAGRRGHRDRRPSRRPAQCRPVECQPGALRDLQLDRRTEVQRLPPASVPAACTPKS